MIRKKIVGVVGSSMMGSDPFARSTWSGSSRSFFTECTRRGILRRAIGVEADAWRRSWALARNFSPDRSMWRLGFYLDFGYYKGLTRAIARQISQDDYACDFLQIGAVYDVPSVVRGRARCFSYHDGNLAQLAKSPHFPKDFPRKKLARAIEFERRVYAGMDRIFTFSEYLRRSFIDDFGVPESKLVTIGGGLNLAPPAYCANKDYSTGQILFVGGNFERKGGWDLLEAFRCVRSKRPAATLHIVGPRRLSIPAELEGGVKCHGFLDSRDPAQGATFRRLLSNAVLFVMPSLYEPFGIAPLEAMAYQTPCIVTNRWALPEMVAPGVNGELVEPGNPGELADRMLTLLNQPELLQAYGEAARASVLERYSWAAVVSNLVRAMNPAYAV